MTFSFNFIIFYHKIYFEKITEFSLYTVVQNLGFSRKANNCIKNRARVANNASNNIMYFFLLYLSVVLTVKFHYKSIFRITKN